MSTSRAIRKSTPPQVKAVHLDSLEEIRITCPMCKRGTIELVTDGLVGRMIAPPFFNPDKDRLEYRMEPRPFGACNACEFCVEIVR